MASQDDSNSSISVSQVRRAEFIGSNGETVTRVMYFVSSNNRPLYPHLTVTPLPQDVVALLPATPGYQAMVYNRSGLVEYHACYRVLVYNHPENPDMALSEMLLVEAWNISHTATNITVDIVKTEDFAGDFGFCQQ